VSEGSNPSPSACCRRGCPLYEHHSHPPLSRRFFLRRMANHFLATLGIIAFSLLLGMAGYHYFEGLSWLDAFVDSAMLLGGMGPVHMPTTDAGKLFAGCYALYAGLVFLVTAGIILSPVIHRVLHKFHWEQRDRNHGSHG
jgi:hypothetical protein